MSFTAEDLKRLKEDIARGGEIGTSRLEPLLIRLDRAEIVAKHIEDREYKKGREELDLKAWRKAKGDTSDASNSKGEI